MDALHDVLFFFLISIYFAALSIRSLRNDDANGNTNAAKSIILVNIGLGKIIDLHMRHTFKHISLISSNSSQCSFRKLNDREQSRTCSRNAKRVTFLDDFLAVSTSCSKFYSPLFLARNFTLHILRSLSYIIPSP